MGDGYRLVLALPVEPRVGLLVELQGPGQRKPDQKIPACLEVQAVLGRCRMDQTERDLAVILGSNVFGGFQDSCLGEALSDAL
ncbi:hypothetical protein FRC0547_00827 [Corynebacterium diphtheriae]|nr:hypothetical protein FRC0515_00762 [Corynebacterium diphtheriae]CAB1034757.1 hypothetical protein FRC0547_00827 [Corynebacterium diphtheriae]